MSEARPMLDDTPAVVRIYQAWQGMSDWLRELRVRKDLQPTLSKLREYAELNLARNHGAIEYLGCSSMAQREGNDDLKAFLTQKRADGRAPFFKPSDLSPESTLQLLVQVGGRHPSRTFEGPGGRQFDGPASVLPIISNAALREKYGDNLSALQIMYVICKESNKVRAATWARSMYGIVNAVGNEYAMDQGLEREMKRRYTVKPRKKQADEIRREFEVMKADAKRALEHGITTQKPDQSPADMLEQLAKGNSPEKLTEVYNLLGAKLGLAPGAAPATPVQALQQAVQGDAAGTAPSPVVPAAKPAPAKRTRRKAADKAEPQ